VNAPAAAEAPAPTLRLYTKIALPGEMLLTYQNAGLDLSHDLEQTLHHLVVLGVPDLVALQMTLGPMLDEQSVDIHHPDVVARFLLGATVRLHRFHAEVGDPDSRLQDRPIVSP